ncbi:N-acetylmuramoyl-L-alanine amidase [Paenibacillus sp. MZ04-78.2]|nr:N-acetylmuramoyl-L-alanine amidase [Paenibacillus sp. MZ04-78.2]
MLRPPAQSERGVQAVIWVLAYACYRYGLNPATDITGHHILDPARKTDPVNALRLLGKTFRQFVDDVVAEYQECTQEEDEDDMAKALVFEHDWQWKQLGYLGR